MRNFVVTLPQPKRTPTHRRHAQDEGMDVHKLLGKAGSGFPLLRVASGRLHARARVEEASKPPSSHPLLPARPTFAYHYIRSRSPVYGVRTVQTPCPAPFHATGRQRYAAYGRLAPFISIILLIPPLPPPLTDPAHRCTPHPPHHGGQRPGHDAASRQGQAKESRCPGRSSEE